MLRLFLLLSLGLLAGCASPPQPAKAPGNAARPPLSDTLGAQAPPLNVAAFERLVHTRINTARRRHDLPPMVWNDSLHALARAYSRDMARRGFFSHTSPEGQDVNTRGATLGLVCTKRLGGGRIGRGIGENLAVAHRLAGFGDVMAHTVRNGRRIESKHVERRYEWKTPEELAREVVTGWLESTGHRANVLSTVYQTHALGAALAPDGHLYVTQNLC